VIEQTVATPKKENTFTIQVTVGYLIVYGLVIALIAGILAFWYSRSNDDMRKVIAYGSSLFGAMVALMTLLYTAQNIRQANDERKRSAAAKFVERWNTPGLTSSKKDWWSLNDELGKLSPEERAKTLEAELSKRMTATEFLNFFEEMAVAINTASADEELLQRFFRTVLLTYWDRYSYWITEHRKTTGKVRVYIEFQQVVERWMESPKV
jgi:hypothetical protein